jgi:hypothetical protein
MTRTRCFGAAFLLLATSCLSIAQVKKSGLTGAAFLKVGVGARAVAMGSAVASVSEDLNQFFWNPAGIAMSNDQWQATFHLNQWIADLNHNAAAIGHSFGKIGTIAVGFTSLGVSDIAADRDAIPSFLMGSITPNDTETGSTYDYLDLALQVTWARNFTDKLSLGTSFKVVSQSIDSESATTYAFDFGVIYRVGFRDATIGARINNLGKDLTFYDIGAPLPLIFSIGASISLYANEKNNFLVTADATKPQDAEQLIFAGGEYTFNDFVSVRGGWKFNYSGIDDSKRNEFDGEVISVPRTEEGLSFGGGLNLPIGGNRVLVDYAYTEFGILDSVNRFSISVMF